MKRIVIVGGVAGGMSAATRSRRLDPDASIIVLERSSYVSYANCGLPYFVGGVISAQTDLLLQTPESLHDRFRLDVRVQSEVIGIDRAAKTLTVRDLASGETYDLEYDYLVLSPGAQPVVPDLPKAAGCACHRQHDDKPDQRPPGHQFKGIKHRRNRAACNRHGRKGQDRSGHPPGCGAGVDRVWQGRGSFCVGVDPVAQGHVRPCQTGHSAPGFRSLSRVHSVVRGAPMQGRKKPKDSPVAAINCCVD
jgi:NADPH-dependent 2,4-dienoyl-CoA reductase/sulfur reductase-like enzyme